MAYNQKVRLFLQKKVQPESPPSLTGGQSSMYKCAGEYGLKEQNLQKDVRRWKENAWQPRIQLVLSFFSPPAVCPVSSFFSYLPLQQLCDIAILFQPHFPTFCHLWGKSFIHFSISIEIFGKTRFYSDVLSFTSWKISGSLLETPLFQI